MRLRHIRGAEDTVLAHERVIKPSEQTRGNWQEIFGNRNPLHIEIGMGKGQFITELAMRNPDNNYIGIERYSSVLLRAIEKYDLLEQAPANLYFLNIDARLLTDFFAEGEVDKIYLNFSDPWPKAKHAERRLTSGKYLAIYDQVLAGDGDIEFKTDNRGLFDFSVEELKENPAFEMTACTYDLHHDESMNAGNIMTEYEEKFSSMGNPIHKLVAGRRRNS